jgi:hypothetical protein
MCVVCYTVGSGLGEAVLFGGPFAFTVVRRVRARLGRAADGQAAPAPPPAPAQVVAAREARPPSPPRRQAPAPAQ